MRRLTESDSQAYIFDAEIFSLKKSLYFMIFVDSFLVTGIDKELAPLTK